ncbi:MAG: glycosyltransferase family 39 protein, partial [bacterium]|nr:glycosyltransferase family 39 protein [bacterium]
AEFILLAQSLEDSPYTPYTQLATGHATLYFYILLLSIKFFGPTMFAVRLPSALFGVIDTALIYFVFKAVFDSQEKTSELIKTWMPFMLALLFTSMRWYFGFARFGFEASTVLLFELIGVWAVLLYMQKHHWKYLLIAGLSAGLAYNSYTPGRMFVALPFLFLIIDGFHSTFSFKKLTKVLLIYIVPFIILTLPLNIYFTQNDDNRIYELFFLQSEQLSIAEKTDFMTQNIMAVGGMFLGKGDMNGRHNYPGKAMLNPILGLLFIAGLIISLAKWKKGYNAFFLVYFGLGILPPLLTYPWENPNALRAVTVIPSIVYFAGQALLMMFQVKFPVPKRFIMYLVFVIISLSAIYELRTYFVFQRLVFPQSFEIHPTLLQPYLDGTFDFKTKAI